MSKKKTLTDEFFSNITISDSESHSSLNSLEEASDCEPTSFPVKKPQIEVDSDYNSKSPCASDVEVEKQEEIFNKNISKVIKKTAALDLLDAIEISDEEEEIVQPKKRKLFSLTNNKFVDSDVEVIEDNEPGPKKSKYKPKKVIVLDSEESDYENRPRRAKKNQSKAKYVDYVDDEKKIQRPSKKAAKKRFESDAESESDYERNSKKSKKATKKRLESDTESESDYEKNTKKENRTEIVSQVKVLDFFNNSPNSDLKQLPYSKDENKIQKVISLRPFLDLEDLKTKLSEHGFIKLYEAAVDVLNKQNQVDNLIRKCKNLSLDIEGKIKRIENLEDKFIIGQPKILNKRLIDFYNFFL
jgi:hypothetical protein